MKQGSFKVMGRYLHNNITNRVYNIYIYLKQDCLISSSVYNVTMSSPAFFTRASVAYPTRGNAVCGMRTVRVITAEVHTAVAS